MPHTSLVEESCIEFGLLAKCTQVLPDVGQHQQQGADDDSLEHLPITTEVCHPGHQQLATQHHKTGHHGHGKAPARQAQLNPWQRKQKGVATQEGMFVRRFSAKGKNTESEFMTLHVYLLM